MYFTIPGLYTQQQPVNGTMTPAQAARLGITIQTTARVPQRPSPSGFASVDESCQYRSNGDDGVETTRIVCYALCLTLHRDESNCLRKHIRRNSQQHQHFKSETMYAQYIYSVELQNNYELFSEAVQMDADWLWYAPSNIRRHRNENCRANRITSPQSKPRRSDPTQCGTD